MLSVPNDYLQYLREKVDVMINLSIGVFFFFLIDYDWKFYTIMAVVKINQSLISNSCWYNPDKCTFST